MQFYLMGHPETGRPSSVTSPTSAANRQGKEDSSSEDHRCEKACPFLLSTHRRDQPSLGRVRGFGLLLLERYVNKARLICRACSRPSARVATRPRSPAGEEGGLKGASLACGLQPFHQGRRLAVSCAAHVPVCLRALLLAGKRSPGDLRAKPAHDL